MLEEEVRRLKHGQNVCYIISGEFHNKHGPLVKLQYPRHIPGFQSGLHGTCNSDPLVNLGSVLIPTNVEYTPGKHDCTVFILYRNKSTNHYEMFPSLPTNTKHEGDEEYDDSEEEVRPDILFFVNVVNTIIDEQNDRGAVIKSVAIGTTLPYFIAFKDLLSQLLDQYISKRNVNDSFQVLVEGYEFFNKLDFSFINKLHSKGRLQRLLADFKNDYSIFKPNSKFLSKLDKWHLPKNDISRDHYIEYISSNCNCKLQVDMIKHDSITTNISLHQFLVPFLSKFLPALSQLADSKFTFRLLVNSTKLSKDVLSQFILSIANTMHSISTIHYRYHKHIDLITYYQHSPVLIFPYMDISLLDSFKHYCKKLISNKTLVFAIIGVANPIFQYQQDTWDFFYNLDTGSLFGPGCAVNSLHKKDGLQRNGSLMIKKFLLLPTTLSPRRVGLMAKLSSYMAELPQRLDNDEVRSLYKRVSIIQLWALLKSAQLRNIHSSHIRDRYILAYKDLVLFPELFDNTVYQLLLLMVNYERALENACMSTTTNQIKSELTNLYKILARLAKIILADKKTMEIFMDLSCHYPHMRLFESYSVAFDNFANINLKDHFYHYAYSKPTYWSHLYRDKDQSSFLAKFSSTVFYNMLHLPFIFTAVDFSNNTSNSILPPSITTSVMKHSASMKRSISLKKLIPVSRKASRSSNSLSSMANSDTFSITSLPTAEKKLLICNSSELIENLLVQILHKMELDCVGKMLVRKYTSASLYSAYLTAKEKVMTISENKST